MTPLDYDFLRKLVKERSGLVLSADKQYLVESRLLPVARKAGLASLSELVQRLKGPNAQALAVEVVEAMMTNELFFFRDKLPFEHFRDTIIPSLMAARASQRRIRIWCAAASTGQEPYSLAMCLKEMAPQVAGWRIDILATDLSNEVLEKAKAGIYSQFEVQRGLPIQLLVKYFTQVGETWQIAPEIRAMVQFRPFNLLNDFAGLGMFDVVFCRNVLIYFDQPTKVGVLDRMARTVERDGYLVLGAAETVVGLTDSFKPVAGPARALCAERRRARGGRASARWSPAAASTPRQSLRLGDRPRGWFRHCRHRMVIVPPVRGSRANDEDHRMKVAQAISRALVSEGVTLAAGIAGQSIWPVIDAHRRLRGSVADVCAAGAGGVRHLRRLCARQRQSGGGVHRRRAGGRQPDGRHRQFLGRTRCRCCSSPGTTSAPGSPASSPRSCRSSRSSRRSASGRR